jgi:hypothetical protein
MGISPVCLFSYTFSEPLRTAGILNPKERRSIMMTDWYERTIKALQLNGKGERTQECYARAMRMLSEFYEKTPDLVSEEELQEYFLHKKNVNKWAPNTMRICYCGITSGG